MAKKSKSTDTIIAIAILLGIIGAIGKTCTYSSSNTYQPTRAPKENNISATAPTKSIVSNKETSNISKSSPEEIKTTQLNTNSNDNLAMGFPSNNGQIIIRQGYALSYNEEHEQANWVSYKLTKWEVQNNNIKRTNNFRKDTAIITGSASLEDYKNSGYDRGHLAPAADMAWSQTVMSESFYMSNMTPQKPGFNRGIWKKLEELVRTFAIQNDEIYVVTGPVLTKGLPTIGSNNVTIPNMYYKVILDSKQPEIKAIGFILKNESSKNNLSSFAVSVDSVENLTGLDFFSALPDDIETRVESKYTISAWDFSTSSITRTTKPESQSKNSTKTTLHISSPYVASKNSSVFHKTTCSSAAKIKPSNLIKYNSKAEAEKAGKRPCKKCKP